MSIPPPQPDASGSGERESGVVSIGQLGPYRLLKLIGSGAMGNVYEAEHVLLGRRVAIKMLRQELAGTPSFAQRLFAEARASDLVGDEHMVKVLDLGREPDGMTWFAMELLAGKSLAALCDRKDLSVARALDIARQVCEALTPVHEAGIVHRDIKPENIFVVERDGADFVKLLDFGIARLPEGENPERKAGLEVVLGTPPYMAPEQVFGGEIDARTDLYAVGALLFEMLTGSMLFERSSMTELLAAIVLAEPPVPSDYASLPDAVRAQIDGVVTRCLAKNAVSRPNNARELAGELAGIAFCLSHGDDDEIVPENESALPEPVAPLAPWSEPSVALALAAFDAPDPFLPDGSRVRARRRAPALVACAAAIATWLAPTSSLLQVQPAFATVGGWVAGWVAEPAPATVHAEALLDASSTLPR